MTNDYHDPKLLVGLDAPDDAAVYQIAPDVAIVQTVDFFTPIVDDAYSWGRIAAANALSDVYAMGASPKTALNLVGWPRDLGFELLGAVIEGSGDACHEAGVTVVGGHSIDDPEPKFGLSVTGTVHPHRIVTKTGASEGCELVLTKPLGMGIISSGIKVGKTSEETGQRAIRIMSTLNRSACESMVEVGAEAATDVTGFGLVGHLLQMLDGRLDADLHYASIPVVEEAVTLAAGGVFPAGSQRNREAGQGRVVAGELGEASLALLYDAQTSGGLLIAVAPEKLDRLMRSLAERGVEDAARIGELKSGDGRVRVG
ncbi:MAG: selenide, water dikinase SelD [Actinomycetota bacterium]|nr:selenide, water dikinase SelD [Actinomycetota bacterium]